PKASDVDVERRRGLLRALCFGAGVLALNQRTLAAAFIRPSSEGGEAANLEPCPCTSTWVDRTSTTFTYPPSYTTSGTSTGDCTHTGTSSTTVSVGGTASTTSAVETDVDGQKVTIFQSMTESNSPSATWSITDSCSQGTPLTYTATISNSYTGTASRSWTVSSSVTYTTECDQYLGRESSKVPHLVPDDWLMIPSQLRFITLDQQASVVDHSTRGGRSRLSIPRFL